MDFKYINLCIQAVPSKPTFVLGFVLFFSFIPSCYMHIILIEEFLIFPQIEILSRTTLKIFGVGGHSN